MTVQEQGLAALSIGDKAWRINSVRRHTFECTVVDIGKHTIGVTEDARPGRILWFDIYSGRPAGWTGSDASPLLVLADDPMLAKVRGISEVEHRHFEFKGRMKAAIEKLPGSPADWDAAFKVFDDWENFTVNNPQEA